MAKPLTNEDLKILEEEVRWFLTWKMEPERIAHILGVSCDAMSKRFDRAGIEDLYKLFRYNDINRKRSNIARQRRARTSRTRNKNRSQQ